MKAQSAHLLRYQGVKWVFMFILFHLIFASGLYGIGQYHRNDSLPELIPYPSPTYEQQPTLQWHKPVLAVVTYYIQIGVEPSFTSPLIFVSAPDTQYITPIELPVDTIYWRVKADSGAWSETGSDTI